MLSSITFELIGGGAQKHHERISCVWEVLWGDSRAHQTLELLFVASSELLQKKGAIFPRVYIFLDQDLPKT